MSSNTMNDSPTPGPSNKWKRRNSYWIILPIVTFGLASWWGFASAWRKTKRRRYLVAGIIYFIAAAVMWQGLNAENEATDAQAGALLIAWLVAPINAAVWNKQLLSELWKKEIQDRFDMASATANRYLETQPESSVVQFGKLPSDAEESIPPKPITHAAPTSPKPNPDYTQASAPARNSFPNTDRFLSTEVDVNSASQAELESLGAMPKGLPARIVENREKLGPFLDLSDLVARLDIKPHQLITFRTLIAFASSPTAGDFTPHTDARETPQNTQSRTRSKGRVLDF